MDRNVMKQIYQSTNDPYKRIENKRQSENQKKKIQRQDRRTRMFNERRTIVSEDNVENMSGNTTTNNDNLYPSEENKVLARKLALQKYKLEKEKIKMTLHSKKKPPFVVGIPHHGNSPILKKTENNTKLKSLKTEPNPRNQRVTRANTKLKEEQVNSKRKEKGNVLKEQGSHLKSPVRVFPFQERKSVFTFQHNKVTAVKKLTSPHTPTVLKRSARKVQVDIPVPKDVKNKVKNPRPFGTLMKNVPQARTKPSTSSEASSGKLIKSEKIMIVQSRTEDALHPPKTSTESDLAVSLSSSDSLESIIEEQTETPPEPKTESQEIAAEHEELNSETTLQRDRVNKESDRLLSLAEEWETMGPKHNIPADVVDEIDCVVGQTRLLTRDKFNQFRRLIDQYESQQGSQKMTLEDLNGFWDMVYLQVEPLIKRYTKLEVLKNSGWHEPKRSTPPKKKRRVVQKRRTARFELNPVSQVATPVRVKEEDPTGSSVGDKTYLNIMDVSRRSNTPRRDSPAPYISMRLSGVGRSLNQPSTPIAESIESTLTPKSILKKKFSGDGETPQKRIALNESSLEFGDIVDKTPRRSIRLMGRTPQARACPSCQSPACYSLNCEVKSGKKASSAKGKRNNTSTQDQDSLETLGEPSNSNCKVKSEKKASSAKGKRNNTSTQDQDSLETLGEPSNSRDVDSENKEIIVSTKKSNFVLRPSKLVLIDSSNKSPAATKHTHFSGKENSSPIEGGMIRRSSRLASVKKVSFTSIEKPKKHFKLPATPHHSKKGYKPDTSFD